jgi:predicted acyltransferase
MSSTASIETGRSGRLVSLDVFRGITVAAMLLVNDPGSWGAIYRPLTHAPWHGWTPTDLIFPFFLFIVGITTQLSLTARRARGARDADLVRRIIRRGVVLVLLGLFASAFPFFPWDRVVHLRIPGVLQRIGIVYLCAALLLLKTSVRTQIAIAAALLVGYWLALTLIPVPGVGPAALSPPDATLAAYIDRLLLDGHLWAETRTWDPEGPLSTLPAIATALGGALVARGLARSTPLSERLNTLYATGVGLLVSGAMWGWVFPINKNLWTSSYVLFSAGMACVTLATCMWLVEIRRSTWWTRPFLVFGVNPIVAFLGSELLARLIYSVIEVPYQGDTVSLESAIHRTLFASWLPPKPASLAFALTVVLLWYLILDALYRRGIVLKV